MVNSKNKISPIESFYLLGQDCIIAKMMLSIRFPHSQSICKTGNQLIDTNSDDDKVFTVKNGAILHSYRFMQIYFHSLQHELTGIKIWTMTGRKNKVKYA